MFADVVRRLLRVNPKERLTRANLYGLLLPHLDSIMNL